MDTCGESLEGKRFDTSLTAGGDGVESAISTGTTKTKTEFNETDLAATNYYFHSLQIIFSTYMVFVLVICFVLSDQQSQTPKYSI